MEISLDTRELKREIKKADKALKDFTSPQFRNKVADSLVKVADDVLGEARRRVPVETGALKESLRVREPTPKSISKPGARLSARVVTGTRARLKIPKTAKGYYPAALEFGYTTKSGKKVAPRPYLRPAIYNRKDAHIRRFAGLMGKQLRIFARTKRGKFRR